MPLETNLSISVKSTDHIAFNEKRLRFFSPLITDYTEFTQPHVAAVRDVLHGRRFRYKFTHENAVLLFDHGCLIGRIYYQGRFFALPPMEEEPDRNPCMRALPIVQQAALVEFCRLPKGILLFYFTLLKQVFDGRTLTCWKWSAGEPDSKSMPIPAPIRPWLQAVGWPYASSDEETGCRAS